MFTAGIKTLFVLAAAWGVSADSLNESVAVMARRLTTTATTCKQTNDFMYTKCAGQGKAFSCCTPDQACIVVNQKSGKKTVKAQTCTKDRKLKGMRAVRVIVIPMFSLIFGCCAVAFMLKFFGLKNPITLICVAVIGISWPLALSQMYTFFLWALFLAMLVAAVCAGSLDIPSYARRILWLVQVFQVMAIFGDYEAFFVPLWGYSGATAASMLGDSMWKTSTCSTWYQNYFAVLALEKAAVKAYPKAESFGLCSEEWLAFVQCAVIAQGLVWMLAAAKTAPMLLSSKVTVASDEQEAKIY